MASNVVSRLRVVSAALRKSYNAGLPIESALTPPSEWYSDPQFAEFDKSSLLSKTWIAVGNSSQVSSPGSYFTCTVGDTGVIVLRDGEGQLRAFKNRCAHRGMQLLPDNSMGVLTEEGLCIKCPYHGWTYSSTGKLNKALRMKGARDFTASKNSLSPVSVDLLGLACFVRLDGAETELDKISYSSLINNIRSISNPEDYTFVKRKVHYVDFDWKIGFENAIDFTHIDHVHKDFSDNLSSTYNLECEETDLFSFQTSFPKPDGSVFGDEPIQYVVMYPNCVFNRFGPWVDNSYWLPVGLNKSKVIFDYFLLKDYVKGKPVAEIETEVEENVSRSSSVQFEDTSICERLQAGMITGFPGGRYSPLTDTATYNYHKFIYNVYAQSLKNALDCSEKDTANM